MVSTHFIIGYGKISLKEYIEDFIKIVESFDTGEIILIIGTRGGANIFEPVEIE